MVAWGSNYYGERDVPAGLTGVSRIVAYGSQSYALKADGTVVGWGNLFGGTIGAVSALANVRERLALLHDVEGQFRHTLRDGVFQVRLELPA